MKGIIMTTTSIAVPAVSAPSLTATKKATAKPSKVKTVQLMTVSKAQFSQALTDAVTNAKQGSEGLKRACIYVIQCKNYQEQTTAISKVADAYAKVCKLLDGDTKAMSSDTARKWVKRNCQKLDPSFKILKSETQKAKEQRERNAKKGANANKVKTATNSGKAGQTEAVKPELKKATYNEMKTELDNIMVAYYDFVANSIPSGNIEALTQTITAFKATVVKLLK